MISSVSPCASQALFTLTLDKRNKCRLLNSGYLCETAGVAEMGVNGQSANWSLNLGTPSGTAAKPRRHPRCYRRAAS